MSLLRINELEAQLQRRDERIAGLEAQANAYKALQTSMDARMTALAERQIKDKEAIETLQSERDANAILTGHIATLEAQLEAVGAGGVSGQPASKAEGLLASTAPERIWLDVGSECPPDAAFEELYEVTWSEDNASGGGIEYVRKDLPAQPAQRLQQSAEDAARWRTFISLPYEIRAEWACNLSLATVLTQWVDQCTIDAAAQKGQTNDQ